LPEGQDANGVAAEAITAMLDGRCRLAIGWTWQRLQRELERLVSQEVRRLHGLTEAAWMRSEWELLPPDDHGEARSIFEEMPGAIPDGAAEAMRHEDEAETARIRKEIESGLEGDEAGKGVFQCLWDGVVKREEIARRLGIGVAAVSAARKRLERKLVEYADKRSRSRGSQNGRHERKGQSGG
jgi:hypothetical protein